MESGDQVRDLDRQFGIPGLAQVVEGNGRLPKVHITSPAAIDEMYLHGAHSTSCQAIDLVDPDLHRRIHVAKANSLTTVVWNPCVQKALALSDLGEVAWQNLICIESSNVSHFAVDLEPGQQHTMKEIVSVFDF